MRTKKQTCLQPTEAAKKQVIDLFLKGWDKRSIMNVSGVSRYFYDKILSEYDGKLSDEARIALSQRIAEAKAAIEPAILREPTIWDTPWTDIVVPERGEWGPKDWVTRPATNYAG